MARRTWLLVAGTLTFAGCFPDLPTTVQQQPAGALNPSTMATVGVKEYAPGQLIVRLRGGGPLEVSLGRINTATGATLKERLLLERTVLLNVDPGREQAVAAVLSRMSEVEYAGLNRAVQLIPCETGECRRPDDPFFGYKWDLHNDGYVRNSAGQMLQATGRPDADVDWLEAYEALGPEFTGSARVAILDTGIRDTHTDLAGKVVAARNFAFLYDDPTFTVDRDGHGTIVAGILAARTNNGTGVPGMAFAPNIRLMNAKVCELYNVGTAEAPDITTLCFVSSTINAIIWAVDNGANVLNLSLGGDYRELEGSPVYQAALQYARSRNVLPVCATGNDAWEPDYTGGIAFPARFPECMAVGSSDWSDQRASYSNYGPQLDVVAPGGDVNPAGTPFSWVLSTYHVDNNAYAWSIGTSMAAPQVAGLAALLYATGTRQASAVADRIRQTADDLGSPGRDNFYGHGRINACRALDPAPLSLNMVGTLRTDDRGDPGWPVVILNDGRFDPTRFDVAELVLGNAPGRGVRVTLVGETYVAALRDADFDGDLDLVVSFPRAELVQLLRQGLTRRTSSMELVLTGNVGCRRVEGRRTVNLSPSLTP
jgi:hypothetical protein